MNRILNTTKFNSEDKGGLFYERRWLVRSKSVLGNGKYFKMDRVSIETDARSRD